MIQTTAADAPQPAVPGAGAAAPATVDAAQRGRRSALPPAWDELWGRPSDEPTRIEWRRLRRVSHELAEKIELVDLNEVFGELVGSQDLREEPVHRWFTYKEGFSPRLLGTVLDELGAPAGLTVADVFGGVATTALAGLLHPKVAEVRSVEYSPFSRFVGKTKLSWPRLDTDRLRTLLHDALGYDHQRPVRLPQLAAFSNPDIFSRPRIQALLAAREHLRELAGANEEERAFFELGLAAVVEDLSGAMKDGRALRIKRQRARRAASLAETDPGFPVRGAVKRALAGQWAAMLDDLEALADEREAVSNTVAHHLAGDARHLHAICLRSGKKAFPDEWAGLSLFSPPYLNCIDYTELYKLELWLMEHITSRAAFRETRLGTLRSHPSLRFDERPYFQDVEGDVIDLVSGLSDWVTQQSRRAETGPIVRQYFEDMLQVWREQHRILQPGAVAVCVVANSTFSRRDRCEDGSRKERWRLPLLTDVVLAHLALIAGFENVEIWSARDLQPRNVRAGCARESLVVARRRRVTG